MLIVDFAKTKIGEHDEICRLEVTGLSLQWRSVCDAQEFARQERAIAKSNVARRWQMLLLRFLFLRIARSRLSRS